MHAVWACAQCIAVHVRRTSNHNDVILPSSAEETMFLTASPSVRDRVILRQDGKAWSQKVKLARARHMQGTDTT